MSEDTLALLRRRKKERDDLRPLIPKSLAALQAWYGRAARLRLVVAMDDAVRAGGA